MGDVVPSARTLASILAIALAAATVPGCRGSKDAPKPDVVLVSIDTLRADAVSWSGSGRAATPALDRVAEAGRVFDEARAHAVVTLPSHASMLTGRLPYDHGIRDNAGFVLGTGTPTLATILAGAGYACGAFVSAFPLDRRFGLARGFSVYDDEVEGHGTRRLLFAERPGRETVSRALAWWEGNADRPRFLFVHLFTPHYPYEPGEPFLSRHRDDPYFGEAEQADAELAPLLERVLGTDRPRDVVVVVTSDHGEGLGEHGERTHGLLAHDATLKIPLAIAAPGRLAPGRDGRPARHVDLLPTILDLAGVPAPAGLPGRSLAGDDAGAAPLYFEALTGFYTRGTAPLHGWMEGAQKAVDVPIPELYDLAADPREERNLAAERAEAHAALVGKIPERAREIGGRGEPDAETVARLKSLGYLASSAAAPPTFGPESDPKRRVALEGEVDDALELARAGKVDDAIAALERILSANPRIGYLYNHVAVLHAERGREAEGLGALARAVALGVASPAMRGNLAVGLAQTGRGSEARALVEPLSESPDPQVQVAIGTVAAILGDGAEARRRFTRALEIDPTFPRGRVQLAVLDLKEGRVAEARAGLERALAEDPMSPDGWNALGAARGTGGDLRGAIEAWERAVALNPRLATAWMNQAAAWTRLGELERAARALASALPHLPPGERERILAAARAAREGRVPESR